MQSLNDAARLAVSGYQGGLAALCARGGWNAETTRKELAGAHGFKLDASKLLLLSQFCIEAGGDNCRAIFNAWNLAHGIVAQLEVRDTMPADRSLVTSTVDTVRASSDLLSHVTSARADGQISDNERRVIERDVATSIASLQGVLAEVQRENEAAKLRAV
jgi:hypothetical protein